MPQSTVSKDDVDKLTRGKPSKHRIGSRQVRHRLRKDEQERLAIARSKGFLLLTASTRAALRNSWYLDCLARKSVCMYVERCAGGLRVTYAQEAHFETISLADFSELAALLDCDASTHPSLKSVTTTQSSIP